MRLRQQLNELNRWQTLLRCDNFYATEARENRGGMAIIRQSEMDLEIVDWSNMLIHYYVRNVGSISKWLT